MSTTGRERGGYAKGRERRDAILAAANEVFATRGFRGASLATIAKRVGMSEPGLLHHFASKEELLLELLKLRDQHDDERIAQARAAPPRAARGRCSSSAARTRSAGHRPPLHDPRRGERRRRPPGARLVPRALLRPPRDPQRPPGRRPARWDPSTPSLDPEDVASQILAMFDGLQLQWLLDPEGVDMVAVFEAFLARLRPPSRPRPPAAAPLTDPCTDDFIIIMDLKVHGELSRRRRLGVLFICALSLFIVGLDITVVNVALRPSGRSSDAGVSGLQWTVDAYTVVMASLLMFSGSMADRFGRKRTFVAGLSVFTLASMLCSLAPTVERSSRSACCRPSARR